MLHALLQVIDNCRRRTARSQWARDRRAFNGTLSSKYRKRYLLNRIGSRDVANSHWIARAIDYAWHRIRSKLDRKPQGWPQGCQPVPVQYEPTKRLEQLWHLQGISASLSSPSCPRRGDGPRYQMKAVTRSAICFASDSPVGTLPFSELSAVDC